MASVLMTPSRLTIDRDRDDRVEHVERRLDLRCGPPASCRRSTRARRPGSRARGAPRCGAPAARGRGVRARAHGELGVGRDAVDRAASSSSETCISLPPKSAMPSSTPVTGASRARRAGPRSAIAVADRQARELGVLRADQHAAARDAAQRRLARRALDRRRGPSAPYTVGVVARPRCPASGRARSRAGRGRRTRIGDTARVSGIAGDRARDAAAARRGRRPSRASGRRPGR